MIDECDGKINRAEQKEKAVGRIFRHVSKREISRVIVGTVRPQHDIQITLYPAVPTLHPTTETTADIIAASPRPLDHRCDDVMRCALHKPTEGDVQLTCCTLWQCSCWGCSSHFLWLTN